MEILRALQETPRLSPKLIASKTDITIQHVRNILTVLLELRLVETPSRGLHQISELGTSFLKKEVKSVYHA